MGCAYLRRHSPLSIRNNADVSSTQRLWWENSRRTNTVCSEFAIRSFKVLVRRGFRTVHILRDYLLASAKNVIVAQPVYFVSLLHHLIGSERRPLNFVCETANVRFASVIRLAVIFYYYYVESCFGEWISWVTWKPSYRWFDLIINKTKGSWRKKQLFVFSSR